MHFLSTAYCVLRTSVKLLSVRARVRVDVRSTQYAAEKSRARVRVRIRVDIRSTQYAAEKIQARVRADVRSTQYAEKK